jgi:hypothetical protein
VRGRRGPRLGGLAVVLVLGMAGCATAPARLPPVLGGVPADQVDALVRRWADEWASFRGLRAAVDLTVVRDGRAQRTAGALLLSPTHLRFEAITPIGLPALVLTVAPDRLLVYSPTEGKAWTARPTAEAMGRWLGTPVEPAALIRLLTGHVPPPADGTPVRVGQDRGPHVVLQREAGIERVWVTTEGRPARLEMENGRRVTATFDRATDGLVISLAVEVPSQSLQVHLRYISGESMAPPPAAFELTVPAGVPIERVD